MSPSFFSKDAEDGYRALCQDIRGYRARHTEERPALKEMPTQNLHYHGVSAVKIVVTAILTSIGIAIGYSIWVYVQGWF